MCDFEDNKYIYFGEIIYKNDTIFNGYEDLEKYPDTPSHRAKYPELYNFTFYHFPCYIERKEQGFFCGYVKVGDFWKDYESALYVHGGITYANKERGVIGFDTMHCYDKSPFSVSPHGDGGRYYRDRDYVVTELKELCRQLLALLPKWSPSTHKQFPPSLRKSIWEVYKIWYLRKQSKYFSKILERNIWIDIVNYVFELKNIKN